MSTKLVKGKIYVTQLVSELDWDDEVNNPVGVYDIEAQLDPSVNPTEGESPEETALLDEFHRRVPIACVEDFEIKVVLKDT